MAYQISTKTMGLRRPRARLSSFPFSSPVLQHAGGGLDAIHGVATRAVLEQIASGRARGPGATLKYGWCCCSLTILRDVIRAGWKPGIHVWDLAELMELSTPVEKFP